MNRKDSNSRGKSNGERKKSLGKGNPNKGKPAFKKNAVKPEVAKSVVSKTPTVKRAKSADEMRLNKYIANSGVCSRREADVYIQSGNVKVNGVVITEMGHLVKESDTIHFDGSLLSLGKKEYILLNKPKNFTTVGDNENEPRNVLELVRGATNANILPVGRMDKNTTGLLLFTNDTDILRKFTLPNQKTSKIYQVSLDKNLKFEDLEKIATGVMLDGHRVFVEEISYIDNEPKSEVGIKLRTSHVKVVRAIFEHFKYDVLRVDRVAYAGLTKKNLPRGNWRFLTEQEIINLRNM